MNSAILKFYRQQSAFTDPGKYALLFDELPNTAPGLARAVQGLIIQQFALPLYGIRHDEIVDTGFGVRAIESLIEQVLRLDNSPLSHAREPRRRLGANCRNFGTLFTAMLRHKGIPARERIGFGGYFRGPINYEHRITEYWDGAQNRWVLADSQIDGVQRRGNPKIDFDTLNILPGDPLYLSGDVWQKARRNEVDPNRFGDSDTDLGMPMIRYALLHDFDALNKFEVLGCDDWGSLIQKPEQELTRQDMDFLDQVAELITDPDTNFDAMRELHASSEYGKEVCAQARNVGMIA